MNKSPSEKKVARTILLPGDVDKWVKDYAPAANTNVSELITHLLYQKKAQVEKQDKRAPERA